MNSDKQCIIVLFFLLQSRGREIESMRERERERERGGGVNTPIFQKSQHLKFN